MPVREGVQYVGRAATRPIGLVGTYVIFLWKTFRGFVVPSVQWRHLTRQMEFVGNRSIGVILLASLGVGSVFGLQFGDIFRIFGAEGMIGAAAGFALSKELAPVITAFLVTGRGGSAMAAEIATMKVNEQIDALRVMAVDPFNYLIAPRMIAAMIMTPLLSGVFLLNGVLASLITGVVFFDVGVGIFLEKIVWIIRFEHVMDGLQKAAAFGLVFSSIGCFKGYHAQGGAKGVGIAVTQAVVTSLVAILVVDFIISFVQLRFS